MHIDKLGGEQLRAGLGQRVQDSAEESAKKTVRSVNQSERADRVDISEQGRALAAEEAEKARAGLSAERISEIREKIRSGFYSTPEMAEKVAERMIELGEAPFPTAETEEPNP